MRVLTINTYGGSLLLGARAVGAEVIGSLEDSGYGSDVQRLNFGGQFPIVASHAEWPSASLEGVTVVAHPPCSAFSQQNNSVSKRGVDTEAFGCHVRVLAYAMGHRADAVVIESVVGALEGARAVYEEFASRHGYDLFRILLNSRTIGVPQNRPRFWAVFVRRAVERWSESLAVRHAPVYSYIRDVMETGVVSDDDVDAASRRTLIRLMDHWRRNGLDDAWIELALRGEFGFGQLPKIPEGGIWYDTWAFKPFRSKDPRLFDPATQATVLLGDVVWLVPGRLMTRGEYKRVMGFPTEYAFPEKMLTGAYKTYLSKGVAPPVAAWVLDQVRNNLYGNSQWNVDGDRTHEVLLGGVLDIRPPQKEGARAEG